MKVVRMTHPARRRGLLAAVHLLLITLSAQGLYVVDFEGVGETKPGNASGTVNLSGKNWNLTEALIGTGISDWRIGNRSARLRGYAASAMTMLEDLPDGLGVVSFKYRRYGTEEQVDWRVEYSTNAGANWTQIGADFTAPDSDEVQTFSHVVNVQGNARIRIKRATETGTVNRRLNVDDIAISPFGQSTLNVALDPEDDFVVVTGTSAEIAATAANGAAPYTYAWTSTLNSTHWQAAGNLFTILATAPAGFYSATVQASDVDSNEAERTVQFEVRTLYPITLAPPVNGLVALDPPDVAFAGTTVQVLATPDWGYAVESISVVGADASAVPVAPDNTFEMPAQSVTVTVLFAQTDDPDFLVDFEDLTGGYEAKTYEAGGTSWTMLGFWAGASPGQDRLIGTQSARIEHNRDGQGPAYMQSGAYPDSIRQITFWYANFVGHDGGTFKVQVSANGTDWEDAGAPEYNPEPDADLVLGSVDYVPPGMTHLRIITTGGGPLGRISLDNVGIYLGEPRPSLMYQGETEGMARRSMQIAFTLRNALAADWAVALEDEDGVPLEDSGEFDPDTRIWSWRPSAAGNYTLTVAALDSMGALIAEVLVPLTVAPPPPLDPPKLTIIPADDGSNDFFFDVPEDANTIEVEGATPQTIVQENGWALLVPGEDYELDGSRVRVLTGAADARMVRVRLAP